jgi:hypothetical protein
VKDYQNKKDHREKKEQGNNVDYGEVVTFVSALSISSHDDAWYIDFGTSMHLSHKQEWFKDFDDLPQRQFNSRSNC